MTSTNKPIDLETGFSWKSDASPTPANRFQGPNQGSFRNAEVDRLYDLVIASIKPIERKQAEIALHSRMTELVAMGPLYYPADIVMARNTVKGVHGHSSFPANSWNIYEWELTS